MQRQIANHLVEAAWCPLVIALCIATEALTTSDHPNWEAAWMLRIHTWALCTCLLLICNHRLGLIHPGLDTARRVTRQKVLGLALLCSPPVLVWAVLRGGGLLQLLGVFFALLLIWQTVSMAVLLIWLPPVPLQRLLRAEVHLGGVVSACLLMRGCGLEFTIGDAMIGTLGVLSLEGSARRCVEMQRQPFSSASQTQLLAAAERYKEVIYEAAEDWPRMKSPVN